MKKKTVKNGKEGNVQRRLSYVLMATVLTFVLSLSMAFAAEQPLGFSFAEHEVKASQVISGSIVLNDSSTTNGTVVVNYDSKKMQLLKAKKADGQDSLYVSINDGKEGEILIAFADEEKLESGAVVNLEFKIADQLKPGEKFKTTADISKVYDESNGDLEGTEISEEFVAVGEDTDTSINEGAGTVNGNDSGNQGGGNVQEKPPQNGTDDIAITGDNAKLFLYIVIALAVAGVMIFTIRKAKGDKNE